MLTFTHDGEEFDLVTSVDDLDIDDAEILEDELGLDLRDINLRSMKLHRMARIFVLLSLRKKRPGATLADAGKVRLAAFLAAFGDDDAPAPGPASDGRPPVEFTGSVELGTAAADATDGGEEVLSPGSAVSEASGALTAPAGMPGA